MELEDNRKLIKLCENLSGSISDGYFNSALDNVSISLERMYEDYGYGAVLGALSTVWSLENAVTYFSKVVNCVKNKKKDIRTIVTSYHRAYNGGVERVQAQLMTLWVQMGYRVILLTEESENELDYCYPDEVKRFIIPKESDINHRLIAIQQICVNEQVGLFINHAWESDSTLWECILMKMLNIPYVLHTHGHFAWSIWKSRQTLLQPNIFKLCDLVISLSETNARFYQLCGCQSYMVQNPVPEDLRRNKERSKGIENRILLIGRVSKEKYPMHALQIFKIVHDRLSHVVLDVVGGAEDDCAEQMRAYVSEHNIQNNVVFHGLKSQAEVAEFYKQATCVLFTSGMEGYPMVILETKSFGVPLVMYELPYLSLVKDGNGILTAKFGDMNTMAQHVICILEDEPYRECLSKAARKSFEYFCAYDLEGTWKNIFALCVNGEMQDNSGGYYNPAEISEADKYIEPMLLESMRGGYEFILKSNVDYQVGELLLKYPRKLKRFLRIIKGKLLYGK